MDLIKKKKEVLGRRGEREGACYAEPENVDIAKRLAWAKSKTPVHKGGTGTVPSTIADEKICNPFARIDSSKRLDKSHTLEQKRIREEAVHDLLSQSRTLLEMPALVTDDVMLMSQTRVENSKNNIFF